MAEQGYWVVCEEIHTNKTQLNKDHNKKPEPAVCMGSVDGFHYTDVMAGSRMEVLAMVRQKLKDNIDFLLNCYYDVPQPSTSDEPPSDKLVHGAAYIFVGLAELGVMAEMLTPMIS